MPMDSVFSEILIEFDEKEMRLHSEKALYEEIKNTFFSTWKREPILARVLVSAFSDGEILV